MTFYEGCPQEAVDPCEFPVVTGATISTGHEFVLFTIVHLHLDKCMNAHGQVFVVLLLIVHVRAMLDRVLLSSEVLANTLLTPRRAVGCLIFLGGPHVDDGIWFKVFGFTQLSLQLMRISFCI